MCPVERERERNRNSGNGIRSDYDKITFRSPVDQRKGVKKS